MARIYFYFTFWIELKYVLISTGLDEIELIANAEKLPELFESRMREKLKELSKQQEAVVSDRSRQLSRLGYN